MIRIPFRYTRNGAMRFMRLGRYQVSWCATTKPCETHISIDANGLAHAFVLGLWLGALAAVVANYA